MADTLVNRASFTLAAAITSATQTSITRTSAANGLPGDSNGPASGTYVFEMTDGNGNYELARVTGGQGTTTLTIARAVELIGGVQTALANVPSGTVCYAVATAGDLAPPIPSYDTTVLTKLSLAPVAYWKLNDPVGSTTAADSSGNGYTLTVNGTVTFGEPSVVPTDSETSAQGDGSTGYLVTSGTPALVPTSGPFTLIAAIRGTNPGSTYRMIAGWGTTAYLTWGSPNLDGSFESDPNSAYFNGFSPAVAASGSALVGASYDSVNGSIFVNGQLTGSKAVGSSFGSGPVYVLRWANAYDYGNMAIGRVAIFAGVLTPKDWALLMQAFIRVG